jgi:uncharacterized membrane protein
MNKVILAVVFLILGSIYMFCSSRPFLFPNFWKSFLYIVILGYGLGMTILSLPPMKQILPFGIMFSTVIFLFIWLMFNLIIINQDNNKFYEFCTSKIIGEIFGWSILLMFSIVLLVNKRSKYYEEENN